MAIQQTPTTIAYQDLTRFKIDLLVALETLAESSDPPYGIATKEMLEEHYTESKQAAAEDSHVEPVNVNHGRLYPNLDQLVEAGLVEKGQLDRRTNWYRLTDAGEQMLADIREWICDAEQSG